MGRTWTASQNTAITLHGRSLLVSAAAGSGKTSVLTERIIRSLLDPDSPADLSKMLVVTFTRAAAAELKSRISEALSEALAKDPANKRLSEQLFLLGSAQISTIDSFFQRIVRANFDTLGLPASFRIASESEILSLSSEVLDRLIEEFYRLNPPNEDAGLFDGILNNSFARAMDHLISNRSDGKLNSVLLDFLNSLSSYPQGIELLKENAESLRSGAKNDFFTSDYGRVFADALREETKEYLDALDKIGRYLETDPDAHAVYAPLVADDTYYCTSLMNALDSYGTARSVAIDFHPKSFPGKRNKPTPVLEFQARRAKWRDEDKKNKEIFAFPPEEIARQMECTAELCEVLYSFYSEYLARMMQEKRTRGILEFNDVRGMLYRLLTAPDGTPSEFADSLSKQYDAVYIDEYQDVDQVQDGIFAMIGGSRRFMVGDIKQSIYGFRGSEPSIFAHYRRVMPLYTPGDKPSEVGSSIFMSDNFRCDRPVIEFTNLVCRFLFSACEASVSYRPEDDLVCSKRDPENPSPTFPSPVTVSIFEKPPQKIDETEEEESCSSEEHLWVAGEISRLLRKEVLDDGCPITPSDIAILVRTKAQGTAYKLALDELQIPVNLTTSSDILQDPILIDTLNLLRTIDNPYRDVPLSEYLVSSFGGFLLEEIGRIRASAPDTKALYDAMREFAAKEDESDALAQKTRERLMWLEHLQSTAIAEPADRFLRLLYREEPLSHMADEPALLFLYDQARTYQKSSWCGLYGFLRHFEKLEENGSVSAGGFEQEESAVTIMTVHHSKGLEFPVVFLCSTGSGFNKQDMGKTMLYHKSAGLSTKLYSTESGNTSDTALRAVVKQQIMLEQNEENIRTLYVALTRARERLYVTGTLSGKWESAMQKAENIKRGSRSDILGCNSYLAWILAALSQKEVAELTDRPIFTHYPNGTIEKGLPFEKAQKKERETEDAMSDPTVRRYAAILEKQKDFVYPLAHLKGLPTKAAASRLTEDLLDVLLNEENEGEAILAQISLIESTPKSFDLLLRSDQAPKATDIGTATHAFLEFCDFEKLLRDGVDNECRRLVDQGYVLKKETELINRRQLALFRESNLMHWLTKAKRIYREQRFGMQVSMADLTRDAERKTRLKDHKIFVQGSIDLLLQMPDGRLLLIDYKTDRVTDEERANEALLIRNMKKKHGVQLSYYAKAVRDLFGKEPDGIFIYSLPLGKAIELCDMVQ